MKLKLKLAIELPEGATEEFVERQMEWVRSQVMSGLANFNGEALFLPCGLPHRRELVAGKDMDKVGSWELVKDDDA